MASPPRTGRRRYLVDLVEREMGREPWTPTMESGLLFGFKALCTVSRGPQLNVNRQQRWPQVVSRQCFKRNAPRLKTHANTLRSNPDGAGRHTVPYRAMHRTNRASLPKAPEPNAV
jgi:hypothetical protein